MYGNSQYATKGLHDVVAERQRQISVEGFNVAHDDEHTKGELAKAAMCYIAPDPLNSCIFDNWPWAQNDWKPMDRRRDLVRGVALALAEIDRLDRLAEKEQFDRLTMKGME